MDIKDITELYAVSIAAIAASLLTYCIGTVTYAFFVANFQYLALRRLVYPLLPSWIRHRTNMTRFQGGLLGCYIVINGFCMLDAFCVLNGFCMGLGIKSSSDLLIRSGTMASINMIPLFLGGRTSVLANFVGISLHSYYLAHHWIGRVVVVQSLLHVALVIVKGKPWSLDSFQLSGISSASAIALIFVSSLWFVRRLAYEYFLKIHFVLAFVAIWALLKHLLPTGHNASIFPIASLSLWGLNMVVRLIRIVYYNTEGRRDGKLRPDEEKPQAEEKAQATMVPYYGSAGKKHVIAIKMSLRLKQPMKMRPDQYMYLFLSDMGVRRRFQAHPYVITWWDDSMSATNVHFLIQPQGGISSAVVSRNSIRSVIVDGPYGKDHHLEDYENVVLIARGIGIAGILPHVRHMTYRRLSKDEEHDAYRRGMITRKLSVFWVLDDNHEEDMVSEWLSELQKRDSEKVLLTFLCLYPQQMIRPPPIPSDTHWKFVYKAKKPLEMIQTLMNRTIQRSAGRTKVVVCGIPDFSESIRKKVLETMDQYRDVEFAELEFHPQGVRQAYPGIKSIATEEFELEGMGNGKRRSVRRLMSESVLNKLRSEAGPSDPVEKRNRLVRTRSGTTSKLKTVEEKDEISDRDTASIDEMTRSTQRGKEKENLVRTTRFKRVEDAEANSDLGVPSIDEQAYEKEIV